MSNQSPVGAQHHITSPWKYVATLCGLLVLMLLTIFAAKMSFPGGTVTNNIVAMVIALCKATLVIAIFMGVAQTTKLGKLFALGGFVWLFLLFGVLVDYKARGSERPVTGFHGDAGSALRMGAADDLSHTPGDAASIPTKRDKDEPSE